MTDEGIDITQTCYPTYTPPFTFMNSADFYQFSDDKENEARFCSYNSMSNFIFEIRRVSS